MAPFSFHTFMFPFRWKIKNLEDHPFSKQIDLNNIQYSQSPNWERQAIPPTIDKESDDLYNERNFFYEFVHPALYDNNSETTLIRHYERLEPKQGNVIYRIKCGAGKTIYNLVVQAINLNLYSTGVGVLSIYLYNNLYEDINDVLSINQYGRRIFPAFIGDIVKRGELPHSIGFEGLNGIYSEDFSQYTNLTNSNTPATFITKMIQEVAENIELQPVIDDRMFVLCWYKNDNMTQQFASNYKDFIDNNKDWYKFVFIDKNDGLSCRNEEMRRDIIRKATYERWQELYSLYGVSRYSMVYLTNSDTEKEAPFLFPNFETEYARMAELVLMQRASVLRFSAEITSITKISGKKGFGDRVSSLYREYIRFVNQLYFREISAQDQAIEMYQKLYSAMNVQEEVEKLDNEIQELHNYITIHEDHKTNRTMSLLTWMATIFVPITAITGVFNMNNVALHLTDCGLENLKWYNYASNQFLLMGGVTLLFVVIILLFKSKRTE